MATTLADCERMVEAAERSGKALMIGQNQRLAAAHSKAQELIQEGAIGRLLTFHTAFSATAAPKRGRSIPARTTGSSTRPGRSWAPWRIWGIHKTDLIKYLTDRPDHHGEAKLWARWIKSYPDGSPIQVDDNAIFLLRTQGGALGIAHASWTFYGQEDNSTVLYGTKGILKLYADPDYSVILEHADGQVEKFAVGKITTNEEQQAGIRSSTGVIDEFVAAVTENRPSCLDVDQVIHAMRVVLKAAQ